MSTKLKRVDRDLDDSLDKDLDRTRKQKPSKPTKKQIECFAGKKVKTTKKEEKMKNVDYKKIVETLKTVIIVALVAGVIGFSLGVKYQEQKSEQVNHKITEQIKNLK